jgi:hypothetical protein
MEAFSGIMFRPSFMKPVEPRMQHSIECFVWDTLNLVVMLLKRRRLNGCQIFCLAMIVKFCVMLQYRNV